MNIKQINQRVRTENYTRRQMEMRETTGGWGPKRTRTMTTSDSRNWPVHAVKKKTEKQIKNRPGMWAMQT